MTKEVVENEVRYWIDPQGIKVPYVHIPMQVRKRERLVNSLIRRAKRLQARVAKDKEVMEEAIRNYLAELAADEDEEWVGNALVRNFHGDLAVQVTVSNNMVFDERLTLAKAKIDKYLLRIGRDANPHLIAIVNDVFRVNQTGRVDTKLVLGLRKHEINDPLWKEAMDLISSSLRVQSSKTYFYFQEANEDGKLETIVLDFNKL